jgi:acyl-CoA reductase-like NAD-dependent aldehyde dehydrogenase
VIPYDDEYEAVRLANHSIFGLAGSVREGDRQHVSAALDASATQCSAPPRSGPIRLFLAGASSKSGIGRGYGKPGLGTFVEVNAVHGG